MRDPRYDILFEPVKIGPVETRNRFYQVPHCSGMGRTRPHTLAAMRGTKAEGGWGVVCTEYCSIEPGSDDAAFSFATLWDNEDIRANALATEAIHEHGSLAGVELWLGGSSVGNFDTRLPALGLQSRPAAFGIHPLQSKRIDRKDINNIKKWHADAAVRAVTAGFDIVYVYATHGYLLSEFLDVNSNTRSDEYGGSVENRVRIVRELIEITRDAVAGKAAVATRFSVDLNDPESYDAFALLAEYPDLWDLTVNDYDIEMATSRFQPEGTLAQHVGKARAMTSKPVVAVGRYTSPDTMAAVIKSGNQDLIGAARPSIADPFLPHKIATGRIEDIRECIGCNVCYAYNSIGVPIRCTQNPTMGEEWRRGWHPEKIAAAVSTNRNKRILIVGAGPAGLEAARVLGERGFEVMLADSRPKLGGRVSLESELPGLAEWARVRDWRLTQLNKLPNVGLYPASEMKSDDVIDAEAAVVMLATGASWATDGIGRYRTTPFKGCNSSNVLSADELLQKSHDITGHYLIYDDDHYYIAPVLAQQLLRKGAEVTLVCTEGRVSQWGKYTSEQHSSNVELYNSGVQIVTNHLLHEVDQTNVTIECFYSGKKTRLSADWVIPLTRQSPNDELFKALQTVTERHDTPLLSNIGDCNAPGLIAAAVYSGYKAGVALYNHDVDNTRVLRDLPLV